jgi:hypothetical protein
MGYSGGHPNEIIMLFRERPVPFLHPRLFPLFLQVFQTTGDNLTPAGVSLNCQLIGEINQVFGNAHRHLRYPDPGHNPGSLWHNITP